MREQRAGRATFIPLDTISSKNPDEKYRHLGRAVRLGVDCVEYDGMFERAVQYCLGNGLICDDEGYAKDILYTKKMEVKCIRFRNLLYFE